MPEEQVVAPVPETPQPLPGYTPATPQSIEDDPNHKLAMLISNRGKKKTDTKPDEKPVEKPAAEAKPEPESKPKLNELIAKTLKFGPGSTKKEEANPAEKPAVAEKDAKPEKPVEKQAEKQDESADDSKKSIVTKRAKTVQAIDPTQVATEAATAAATAAVTAIQDKRKPEEPEAKAIEDTLKPADRREYLVAKFLGEQNPKYKGAEQVVLDHIRKSEAYAANWEKENPGKVFNPDDDEHNSFYERLQTPWSEDEFEEAKIDFKVEERVRKQSEAARRNTSEEIEKLTEDSARLELAPVATSAYANAAGALAKALGDDVHNTILKDGFDKLAEKDPVVADVLAGTLGPLKPIIETIIQIDDPKGRVKYNPKRPEHAQWRDILLQGEAMYAGHKDEAGRMFATRMAYSKMTPQQQAKHWYLTQDHLISGVVEFATKTAIELVNQERERVKKAALALGFVEKTAAEKKTPASKEEKKEEAEKQAPAAVKPQSPSVGSGAKIDESGKPHKSTQSTLMGHFSKTLFGQ